MFCIKCGKEIPDYAMFCPDCGQKTIKNMTERQQAVDSQPKETNEAKPEVSVVATKTQPEAVLADNAYEKEKAERNKRIKAKLKADIDTLEDKKSIRVYVVGLLAAVFFCVFIIMATSLPDPDMIESHVESGVAAMFVGAIAIGFALGCVKLSVSWGKLIDEKKSELGDFLAKNNLQEDQENHD